ncbi:MAG: hypothetical protein PWR32_477 [Candidatus Woesearchaeota archaeon]|nr:hypothetical protein [Candidatus Woesearchaeota archaeon]
MSFAASNLGKAILVLIVIVVSTLIFISKLQGASIPLLNWGENPDSSQGSPVLSDIELADRNIQSFLDTLSEKNFAEAKFDLGEGDFFVYFGILNGEWYYLLFKKDPKLGEGNSYSVSLDENLKLKKKRWWWFDKVYQPDFIKNINFQVYNAKKYEKPLLFCEKNKFCVTAKLVNGKTYYSSKYFEENGCKKSFSKTVFISLKNNKFKSLNELPECIDVYELSDKLFDELLDNLSKKGTLSLEGFSELTPNYIYILGLYNDGSSIKNLLLGYDISDYVQSVNELHMFINNRLCNQDYDKIEFNMFFEQYKDLYFMVLNKAFVFDRTIILNDYLKANGVENYVTKKGEFVPILIIYKDGYALFYRNKNSYYGFLEVTCDYNGIQKTISINCEDNHYCYLE